MEFYLKGMLGTYPSSNYVSSIIYLLSIIYLSFYHLSTLHLSMYHLPIYLYIYLLSFLFLPTLNYLLLPYFSLGLIPSQTLLPWILSGSLWKVTGLCWWIWRCSAVSHGDAPRSRACTAATQSYPEGN